MPYQLLYHSRLRGRRMWTIRIYRFYVIPPREVLEAFPKEVVCGAEVEVGWGASGGDSSGYFIPWLASYARMRLLDPGGEIYQTLSEVGDDRDTRCTVASDDGQYRWEGRLRLDTMKTEIVPGIEAPTLDLYAYDGLGQIDRLAPARRFPDGERVGEVLAYGLHLLAALPVRQLISWLTPEARPEEALLHRLGSRTLSRMDGSSGWQDRMREVVSRFLMTIFQDLRIQPGDQRNAWNVVQPWLMPFSWSVSDPGEVSVSHAFEQGVLSEAPWQARRVDLTPDQIEAGGQTKRLTALRAARFSVDVSGARTVGAGGILGGMTSDPYLEQWICGPYRGAEPDCLLPYLSCYGASGVVQSTGADPANEGRGAAARIDPDGYLEQEIGAVGAGDDLLIYYRLRFAMEHVATGPTDARSLATRLPLVQYIIEAPSGQVWTLENNSRNWDYRGASYNPEPVDYSHGILVISEEPNGFGEALTWYDSDEIGGTQGPYNEEVIPASGRLKVRVIAPYAGGEPDTYLHVSALHVRLQRDPQGPQTDPLETEAIDSWEGTLHQYGRQAQALLPLPGAELDVETKLHPSRRDALCIREDDGVRRWTGRWRDPLVPPTAGVRPSASLAQLTYDRLKRLYGDGGRSTFKATVRQILTPSCVLLGKVATINQGRPEGMRGESDYMAYGITSLRVNLAEETSEAECAPLGAVQDSGGGLQPFPIDPPLFF